MLAMLEMEQRRYGREKGYKREEDKEHVAKFNPPVS